MTNATRQQTKRDRAKAGLAHINIWVPQAKLDEILRTVSAILEDEINGTS